MNDPFVGGNCAPKPAISPRSKRPKWWSQDYLCTAEWVDILDHRAQQRSLRSGPTIQIDYGARFHLLIDASSYDIQAQKHLSDQLTLLGGKRVQLYLGNPRDNMPLWFVFDIEAHFTFEHRIDLLLFNTIMQKTLELLTNRVELLAYVNIMKGLTPPPINWPALCAQAHGQLFLDGTVVKLLPNFPFNQPSFDTGASSKPSALKAIKASELRTLQLQSLPFSKTALLRQHLQSTGLSQFIIEQLSGRRSAFRGTRHKSPNTVIGQIESAPQNTSLERSVRNYPTVQNGDQMRIHYDVAQGDYIYMLLISDGRLSDLSRSLPVRRPRHPKRGQLSFKFDNKHAIERPVVLICAQMITNFQEILGRLHERVLVSDYDTILALLSECTNSLSTQFTLWDLGPYNHLPALPT